MEQSRFLFWQRWLIIANVITMGVGLLVAFAPESILLSLHNQATERVFFEGNALSPEVLRLKQWLFGIIGGTIVGFHVLMLYIVIYPFRRREYWAFQALWLSLLSWFLIDSGLSWYYGAVHNIVLINLVALILIGIPLLATSRAFKKA